jgi:rhodanese-related sulfurtransferase
LTRMGYKKVRRYAGGIEEWQKAGYPLEGDFVS